MDYQPAKWKKKKKEKENISLQTFGAWPLQKLLSKYKNEWQVKKPDKEFQKSIF